MFCTRSPSQLQSEESPTDAGLAAVSWGEGEERNLLRTDDRKGKQNQEAEEKVTKNKGPCGVVKL